MADRQKQFVPFTMTSSYSVGVGLLGRSGGVKEVGSFTASIWFQQPVVSGSPYDGTSRVGLTDVIDSGRALYRDEVVSGQILWRMGGVKLGGSDAGTNFGPAINGSYNLMSGAVSLSFGLGAIIPIRDLGKTGSNQDRVSASLFAGVSFDAASWTSPVKAGLVFNARDLPLGVTGVTPGSLGTLGGKPAELVRAGATGQYQLKVQLVDLGAIWHPYYPGNPDRIEQAPDGSLTFYPEAVVGGNNRALTPGTQFFPIPNIRYGLPADISGGDNGDAGSGGGSFAPGSGATGDNQSGDNTGGGASRSGTSPLSDQPPGGNRDPLSGGRASDLGGDGGSQFRPSAVTSAFDHADLADTVNSILNGEYGATSEQRDAVLAYLATQGIDASSDASNSGAGGSAGAGASQPVETAAPSGAGQPEALPEIDIAAAKTTFDASRLSDEQLLGALGEAARAGNDLAAETIDGYNSVNGGGGQLQYYDQPVQDQRGSIDYGTYDTFGSIGSGGYDFSLSGAFADIASAFSDVVDFFGSFDFASIDPMESWAGPVVLDLSGNGINITQLSQSNVFIDSAGDGFQHRTAWAGAGNGVLVLDDGSGKITQQNQFIFTLWDPTATSDMQALLDVFDTNHNGKLDASEVEHGQYTFKILVTNADGTQTLKSFAELGIASIDLNADNTNRAYSDGSSIGGQTKFTYTNGATSTAATVVFASDSTAYTVNSTTTVNGATTAIDNKAYTPDGTLANETWTATTIYDAVQRDIVNSYDDNGDGVVDRTQTETIRTSGGNVVDTFVERNAAGTLGYQTVTTTAANGTVTIQRDTNGNGQFQETETIFTDASGNRVDSTTSRNFDGSTRSVTSTTTSADGLTATDLYDLNGDGVTDQTVQDQTVVNAGDQSRTETVNTWAGSTLVRTEQQWRRADGQSKIVTVDVDGNGSIDLKITQDTTADTATPGATWTSAVSYNGNGSRRSATTTWLSGDNLAKVVYTDSNGDGSWDNIHSDTTVVSGGTRTETVQDTSGNGTLLDKSVTQIFSDGISRTATTDANGDGSTDRVDSISFDSSNSRWEWITDYNPDGSMWRRTATVTTADGLHTTTYVDDNGDGTWDTRRQDDLSVAGDGAHWEWITDYNTDGSWRDQQAISTSADGRTTVTYQRVNGGETWETVTTDSVVAGGDGSQTETVAVVNANGSLRSKTTTVTGADHRSVNTTIDGNGDGHTDQTDNIVTYANDTRQEWITNFNYDGSERNRVVYETSADGLHKITYTDYNGDEWTGSAWHFDLATHDDTILNADGSTSEWITDYNADGSWRDQTSIWTSANGLTTVTSERVNGGPTWETTTRSETVVNADGSQADTTTVTNADGSLRRRTVVTTGSSGLATSYSADVNGDGIVDRTGDDVTTPAADGSSWEWKHDYNANGSLRDQTAIWSKGDGLTRTTWTDFNGDGAWDRIDAVSVDGAGTTWDRITDYNPNGAQRDQTAVATSGDGLRKTTYVDLNGDGVWDTTSHDDINLNADGSTSEWITAYNADGSWRDQALVVTSATGRTKTTYQRVNGGETWERVTTDTYTVNADGSETETVAVTNADGSLRSKTTTVTGADRRSVNTTIDGNGDGHIDQTDNIVTYGNDTRQEWVTNVNYDGSERNRVVYETSADGLHKTTYVDVDGDGAWDTITHDDTSLNADGSTSEWITDYNADGSWRDQTSIWASANGLHKTTAERVNGGPTWESTTSENITQNNDGSTVDDTRTTNADGSLRNRVYVWSNASQLSTTTYSDLNGDWAWDRIQSDAITLNADGSTSEQITTALGGGRRRSATAIWSKGDGITKTTWTDVDGDGAWDRTDAMSVDGAGTSWDWISEYNPNGSLRGQTAIATSGDGLNKTTYVNVNGDGIWDTTTHDDTYLNADGSTSEWITDYNADGSWRDQKLVVTNATRRTKTTYQRVNGGQTWDTTTTETLAVGASGIQTDTVTVANADGSVRQQTVTTRNETARRTDTTYRTYDKGSLTGGFDESVVEQDNGSTVDTTAYLKGDGSTLGSKTVTTSDDGLSTTTSWSTSDSTASPVQHWAYFYYYGVRSYLTNYALLGRQGSVTESDAIALGADGSRTETYTLTGGWSGEAHVPQETIVTTTSANGRLVTGSRTGTNGWQSLTSNWTDVTTVADNGTKVETISVTNATSGTQTDNAVVASSANGLRAVFTLDLNGDGRSEISDTTVTRLDGSRTDTRVELKLDGSLRYQESMTTSPDDRMHALSVRRDTNGDGVFDRFETRHTAVDGSSVDTVWDTTSSGALADRIVTITSADNLSKTVSTDADGDGTVDYVQTVREALNADGSRVSTLSDLNGNGTLRDRTVTTTSANGLNVTTAIDVNGDGIVDETIISATALNSDGGSTRTDTTRYADGALKESTTKTISGDGLTVAIVYHRENGLPDYTETIVTNADGTKTTTDSLQYKNGSSLSTTSITTTSADGRSTFTDIGGNAYMVMQGSYWNGEYNEYYNYIGVSYQEFSNQTTYIANGNGSYIWSNDTGATSSHTIDVNGVDTWANSNTGTVVIDTVSEAKFEAMAARLYDTVLDREIWKSEAESLNKYISNGAFDEAALYNDIVNNTNVIENNTNFSDTEFHAKYGDLSSAELIERFYQNADNRYATVAEISSGLALLASGSLTQAQLAIAIAESSEHAAVGNGHAATSNTFGGFNYVGTDHSTDSSDLFAAVGHIYEAAYNRAPTQSEADAAVGRLQAGTATLQQIAGEQVASSWVWDWWPFFGHTSFPTTNADFVAQIFANALGRAPTAAESATWTGMLDNGQISRGDIIYTLAESPDHAALVGSSEGTGYAVSNATINLAANVAAHIVGANNVINGAAGDIISVGGNGAGGAINTVNASNATLSITADSRADVYGSGNVVTAESGSNVGVWGDSNIVTAAQGDGIWIGGSGDVLQASGATVTLGANTTIDIVGGGNTIYGSSGDAVTIGGNGPAGATNALNLSNGTITLTDSSRLDVAGASNTIRLGDHSSIGVTGDANTFDVGVDDSIWLSGVSENLDYHAEFGQSAVYGFVADGATHDVLQFDSNVFADYSRVQAAITQSGADTLITTANGDVLRLAGVQAASLAVSDFRFV